MIRTTVRIKVLRGKWALNRCAWSRGWRRSGGEVSL